MKIDVRVEDKIIFVQCILSVPYFRDGYSFALAESMIIDGMECCGKNVEYDSLECQMEFKPPMKKITVKDTVGEIVIRYHGGLMGTFAFLERSLIHFSSYNGWYPCGFDVDQDIEVMFHANDTWEMVHAEYIGEKGMWKYVPSKEGFFDCNILLLKRDAYHFFENDKVRFCCMKDCSLQLQSCMDTYSKVYQFYIELYGIDKIGKNTIVYLLEQENCYGGYKRSGLIVFLGIPKDLGNHKHYLAHEMGHSYGCGADCSTWEDWLNETVAEWSALLYEEKYDRNNFEKNIREHQNCMNGEVLNLKECGENRPENVHHVGTLIVYEIYKRYGREAVEVLLKIFDKLTSKTTKGLLEMISDMGRPELADLLKGFME